MSSLEPYSRASEKRASHPRSPTEKRDSPVLPFNSLAQGQKCNSWETTTAVPIAGVGGSDEEGGGGDRGDSKDLGCIWKVESKGVAKWGRFTHDCHSLQHPLLSNLLPQWSSGITVVF